MTNNKVPESPPAGIGSNAASGFVQGLFDERAAGEPGSVALVTETSNLTYGQLHRSANQLAHLLRELGAGPEVLVGVSLERGVDAVRCMLATWKAGGAYLPLDPALPAARLREMCAEAKPAVIITEDLSAAAADRPATQPEVNLHPGNLAYAIYTSGSTGRPKAVAVSHGALVRQIQEVTAAYQMSQRDRVASLASLAFDTSIEQVLVTLISGATLLLPPPGTVAPTDLLRYLAEQRATVVDLTPAYWHQLLAVAVPGDERLDHLRLMITGGELADPADCLAALRAAPRARLVNAYGLTETTITSTLYDIARQPVDIGGQPVDIGRQPGDAGEVTVPVGGPLRHARVLVLDERLEKAADHTAGEIYIGGGGVARGYLRQPGRTAERFVPDPHSADPGARMYRTGDLGRWLAGRGLEVIGRVDRQLKVRGFRVEPAEIEGALATHPAIAAAAVVAHEVSPGNTQLTAYYVRADDNDQPSSDALRDFLAKRVPGFMIPAEFVALHQIPRTPDGDLNRRALTCPTTRALPAEPFTPIQIGLSHLWSRILRRNQVGLDDDFFALGGNSLLAAEMLARARVMFGIGPGYVRPLTRSLLRDATLRAFAEATHDARAGKLNATGLDPYAADLAHDAELDHPVHPHLITETSWRRPVNVLLTGATGFFGIHLLAELLTATEATVYCLVRARDEAHATGRIEQAASRYAVGGLDLSRVAPIPGDLARPRLGLSATEFADLATIIDTVHHVGALVNFIYPYSELRPANVLGTRELIRLASLHRPIPVHYVSTTAVLAGFGVMGVRQVTEDTPLAYAGHLGIGYVESKFVAEELLRNAAREGLPVAIYRPLDIVGDLHSGTWNTTAEMCALVKFMADTGLAPDIDLPLDFVPVDICAKAIGYISTHTAAAGETYHLSSPRYALLGSLVNRLREHGYRIEAVPYSEWVGELVKHAASDPAHPMTPFVPLFVDRCADSELTVAEMYLEHIFPAYTRTRLEQALSGSGIEFPPVDDKLFDRTIGALLASGYLPPPGQSG